MNRTPVVSTQIASIGYEPSQQILEVEFLDGSINQYFEVPKYHHVALMSAPSLSTYLETFIAKGGYHFSKIT